MYDVNLSQLLGLEMALYKHIGLFPLTGNLLYTRTDTQLNSELFPAFIVMKYKYQFNFASFQQLTTVKNRRGDLKDIEIIKKMAFWLSKWSSG